MSLIKEFIKGQLADFSPVKPFCRFDRDNRVFFLVSCAGALRVSPKNVSVFRDKYVNVFEGLETRSEFVKLYRKISEDKDNKTSLKANFRTRFCNVV